jgi:hypothetical protein
MSGSGYGATVRVMRRLARVLAFALLPLGVLCGCEAIPDVVIAEAFDGDAGPGGAAAPDATAAVDANVSPPDSGPGPGPVVDAAPVADASGVVDVGVADTAIGPCPGAPPPGAQCCGGVVCRGKGPICDPQSCASDCAACTAVCCFKNNGDFQGCTATVQACPPA